MNIDKTEWGVCLPDRPYFPMYLANGVDAALINLLGSGDCYWQEYDFGAPLTALRSVGWYKCGRRTMAGTELIYGTMFPLVEFSSCALLNGDYAVPRNCRQYFDPRAATLTSFYEQMDNETGEWLRVKVRTFLSADHLLVEHYEVLSSPMSGTPFALILNTPSPPWLDICKPVVRMDRARMRIDLKDSLMRYEFSLNGIQGGALSWTDCPVEGDIIKEKNELQHVLGKTVTRPMCQGESFTRYLTVLDNLDSEHYSLALEQTILRCRDLGYESILAEHRMFWSDYFGRSEVRLGDPLAEHVYDVSRYLIKANNHPQGMQPVGLLPYLWQGNMFWDACFALQAMLGCGNVTEAVNILNYLESLLPQARELARRIGIRGARIEWSTDIQGFTDYGKPCMQVHNNAVWAHAIYLCYEYTGDVGLLERYFGMMGELLLFLAEGYLVDRCGYLVIGECMGLDESCVDKVNDTWTCAITLKALEEYRYAAEVLHREPIIENLDALISRLGDSLDRNVDASGVLQSFKGGTVPHWGSLVFGLYPDHPSLKPTLDRMMQNYDSQMDLYNLHGVNRYAEKSFPWAQYWVVRILAGAGDHTAFHLLRHALRTVNYFGGIPERVFYHGEYFNNWFSTAHAAMVWAVNSMLADARGDTLRIFNGIDPELQKDISFKGIYAGCSLIVSARMCSRRLENLEITSLHPMERTVRCIFRDGAEARRLLLSPGLNICDLSAWGDTQ